ncbi:siphovirus Gp157 family protein [Zavarzinella formosa]|uniref:siphovirus Gp157 family protein n=1 Tax=Zavarzinella formosa TaxID=360055 RepID=UPI0002DACF2E|nr:siphovirus Gp157 family protein [Zavarzinella formosa]
MQQNEEPQDIRHKLRRLKEIRYVAEDDGCLDLSAGLAESDDFRSLCLEIAEEAVERELQAEVIEARIKELQARKQRVTRTAETLRDVVLQCMDIRGEATIASPILTLSISRRKPDITITDESRLPAKFFVQPPPELDKRALREAVLIDGEIIDGVTVGNGKISLTIRRK